MSLFAAVNAAYQYPEQTNGLKVVESLKVFITVSAQDLSAIVVSDLVLKSPIRY